jgi:hypothetical protein
MNDRDTWKDTATRARARHKHIHATNTRVRGPTTARHSHTTHTTTPETNAFDSHAKQRRPPRESPCAHALQCRDMRRAQHSRAHNEGTLHTHRRTQTPPRAQHRHRENRTRPVLQGGRRRERERERERERGAHTHTRRPERVRVMAGGNTEVRQPRRHPGHTCHAHVCDTGTSCARPLSLRSPPLTHPHTRHHKPHTHTFTNTPHKYTARAKANTHTHTHARAHTSVHTHAHTHTHATHQQHWTVVDRCVDARALLGHR